MTDVGLDYAWAPHPNIDEAWAAGYRFVSRYLSYDTTGKNITKPELDALLAKGFQVALNWEWQTGDMLGGAAKGTEHATEAVKQAQALGYPAGCTITFSCDFDATEAQQATINAYMTAAGLVVHAAGYRIGIYGGYWAVTRSLDAGVCDDAWQTYAWSGGAWDPRAAIRQDQNGITVGGADCDHNTRIGQTYLMGQATGAAAEDHMQVVAFKDKAGQIWRLSGDMLWRERITPTALDHMRYWSNPARHLLTKLELVDLTGGDPVDLEDPDVASALGVDVATLQGGSGATAPHTHTVSGTAA